jgi:hypothetical protein
MAVTNNYTEADILSFNNHSVVAFYNGVLVGVLQEGDHTISLELDTEAVTTSLHGSSPVSTIKKGQEVMITLSLEGINKNRMANILQGTYQVTSDATATPTADTTPSIGSMELVGDPRVLAQDALVLYPIYTDKDGNSFIDDINNNSSFVFPKASCINGFELTYSTQDIIKFDFEFRAHVDVLTSRMAINDKGIASDGTYTPPA